jgi:aspartyl aminopeptidase
MVPGFRIVAGPLLALSLISGSPSQAAPEGCPQGSCQNAWLDFSESEKRRALRFANDYKAFLNAARSELTTVVEAKKLAESKGFRTLPPAHRLAAGEQYYDVNRDRAMVLILGGRRPIAEGVRIMAAHIDSPRLELKARPIYDKETFAQLQTRFHGGIKTYQWVNIPLALIGRVDKKDGKTLNISIGLKAGEPVLIIPDLSPHVDIELRERKGRGVVLHEELDPVAGLWPKSARENTAAALAEILDQQYGVKPQDLVSAELDLVPAMAPRDAGLDASMIAAYGQDDRLGAFAALRALLDSKTPEFTTLVFLADNEESSNNNNTGAGSTYLVDLIENLLYGQVGTNYRSPMLKSALRESRVISVDVSPGINPIWPNAWEAGNAPRLGFGVMIKLYGRGFDANSEYIAWSRDYLDKAKIAWQTTTFKVGRARGGTLGRELSRHNMDVIDIGVPVLSIHTPYALSAKSDVYLLYRAASAFITAAQ